LRFSQFKQGYGLSDLPLYKLRVGEVSSENIFTHLIYQSANHGYHLLFNYAK